MLIWLARIGVYLGLFVGVGGAFFAAWIGQGPSGSTVSRGALAVGLVSAVASLGLQGLDLLNLPLGGIVTSAPWTSALATSLGPSLLIAIVAMAIAWFAWQSPGILIAWVLTTLAMAGVGLSLATSGHAATASPQWLTRPSLFLHGVAAAYWIGALAPLAAMAHRRKDDLPRVLKQFSAIAVLLVALLVLSGLVLSIIQLGSLRALIETQYGIILSIKLSLVILLLGLAALNRFLFTPAVVADYENTRPLLRVDPAWNAFSSFASLPSSPAGASRRRRAPRLLLLPRRSRSISTRMQRCFRCWFRRARSAPTTLCCS